MRFTPLPLAGAYRIDLERRGDSRGFFARLFCREEFRQHGLNEIWSQCNVSYSADQGTLRGMHFQKPPKADAKLVKCMHGAVFDVIVDLRMGSTTFGQWSSVTLTAEGGEMIYIPTGFAHGFQTLTPDAELLYFHSESYSPEHEGGLHHKDADVAIAWPLDIGTISERDKNLPPLTKVDPIS
ncbi:dTDP-4-dehydrorhamnose 3,5-epimerase [Roseibium aggregatum]|uniref:dTDP-4-dehydrorhamnose 3,5-epimerase n=1 Tax=Roseibium aggregatum TaxID=187304 RepID=A0A939EGE1_9HYPH|nr:dTDP-4-dehydrorhamnose 3,5-epimerase [Roseibium aggregatum]MBN9672665.1 dTDP-4-dehydrorhamnose 3,5-epimerase [Roseibium aggregatum]